MNIAVIFAGGSGLRMHTKSRPKQFLELNGKPIIIYTLELFDNHPEIDGIVVACIESWIPFLEKMIRKFESARWSRLYRVATADRTPSITDSVLPRNLPTARMPTCSFMTAYAHSSPRKPLLIISARWKNAAPASPVYQPQRLSS